MHYISGKISDTIIRKQIKMNTEPWIVQELCDLVNNTQSMEKQNEVRKAMVLKIDSNTKSMLLTDGNATITAFIDIDLMLYFQMLLHQPNQENYPIIELKKYYFAITTAKDRMTVKKGILYSSLFFYWNRG